MPLTTRCIQFESDGTAVAGTVTAPPSELAGVYYSFSPNTGSADITIQNLGRTVFSKANAVNADGLQDVAADGEKIVNGQLVVAVTDLAPGAIADIRIFLRI